MGAILCAIYVRLSKEDQDKQQPESESIQNQKSLLVRYAADHGWDIYAVYCDEDWSGADRSRPDFHRMIEAARQKRFQVLLCKSQSRFTRDMELVEKYIHGLFPIWGIRFIAVADNADTEVRGNKKARQINGLVNEWYLEDMSENIRMVFDLKRKEGKYIGGSPIYGYQKDPSDKNHLIPDPEAAEVVRQIYRWSLEGHGRQDIARALERQGIPSPARYKAERGWARPRQGGPSPWNKVTVGRILTNEMYTGVMIQGRRRKVSYKSKAVIDTPESEWYRVEGTHEAIIDRATFQAVQRGLALRSRTDGSGEAHLLAGLVKCADCGSSMIKCSNGRRAYLRCGLYAASGKEGPCTRHSIRLDRLIGLISDRIRYYVQTCYQLDPADLRPRRDARREALEQEQKALTARLEKRGRALKALYLDRAAGILTGGQFAELNQTFWEEKSRLERRLGQVDKELAERGQSQQQAALAERARELLRLETVPRELVVGLVERIEVGERDPETGRQEVAVIWRS